MDVDLNVRQRASARAIEKTGLRNRHDLGPWQLRDIQFQERPQVPGLELEDRQTDRPAILCRDCGAYAAIVDEAGNLFWTPSFERPCAAPPRPPEAA